MSTWVYVPNWIIVYVGIAIKTLRICGIWYNGIGTDPAADLTIIPPCAHQHQLRVTIEALAGELVVGWQGPGAPPRFPEGSIQLSRYNLPVLIGNQARRAEMVTVNIAYPT